MLYDQGEDNSKFVILDKQGKEIKQITCFAPSQGNNYTNGKVIALDNNDNLYQLQLITVNADVDGNQPQEIIKRMQVYSSSGELKKTIELGRTSSSNLEQHVASMAVDAKGRIYILNMGGKIEIIDQDGKPLKSITGDKYSYMDLDIRGNLQVIGESGDGYFLASLNADGKTIWKHKLGEIKKMVLGFKYNPHDDCCYIADNSGIKKYNAKGKFQGEVLNYRSTSIFVSEASINSLGFDAAGKIYINLMYFNSKSDSGQHFSVFKYTPEKAAAQPRNQKVLTVGTADANSVDLEKTARLFEKKHPDVRVEIKDYAPERMTGQDEGCYENYAKTLNTEILSGKGPDIISIQGLPYCKYIDKKVFVDLKALMQKDKSFKRHDYYTNILTACETQGKLYAMPVCFSMPVMIADGTMMEKAHVSIDDASWTWSDFHAAAAKLSQDTNNDGNLETYALPGLDAGEMLNYMLASDYRSFIDEDKKQSHFNSARFIKFLNMYKDLTGAYMNSRIDHQTLLYSGNRGSIAFMPEKYFTGNLSIAKSIMGSQAKALTMPQGIGGDQSFDAVMLGINQNSKMQKEAWEFLKYLTSTEQQTSINLSGLCINQMAQNQVFEKQSQRTEAVGICITSGKGGKTLIMEPLTSAQLARTRQLIADLNHCNNMSSQVKKIIDAEVNSYIRGEKSAAQTAKVLQNKVNLYLNE